MSIAGAEVTYWGNTTDPATYSSDYRYLVHGLNPNARANAILAATIDMQNGIDYDPAWGDQTIDLGRTPEALAGRVSLSASLIDPEHTRTYGNAGLIIAAPEQNIVVTSPIQDGVHNGNRPALLERARTTPIIGGDELIEQTVPGDLNEVVALADHNGLQIQLQGFFFKTTDGVPHDFALTQAMIGHAKRLRKPIVEIATAR